MKVVLQNSIKISRKAVKDIIKNMLISSIITYYFVHWGIIVEIWKYFIFILIIVILTTINIIIDTQKKKCFEEIENINKKFELEKKVYEEEINTLKENKSDIISSYISLNNNLNENIKIPPFLRTSNNRIYK